MIEQERQKFSEMVGNHRKRLKNLWDVFELRIDCATLYEHRVIIDDRTGTSKILRNDGESSKTVEKSLGCFRIADRLRYFIRASGNY